MKGCRAKRHALMVLNDEGAKTFLVFVQTTEYGYIGDEERQARELGQRQEKGFNLSLLS